MASVAIATLLLNSIGNFWDAWLLALFLLSAAIFVKYSFHSIRSMSGYKKWIRILLIAVVSLYWSYLAIVIAYWYFLELKGGVMEAMLINPVFIWMIVGFLVLLEFQIFNRRGKPSKETISIFSNRKKTVLQIDQIAYVESRSHFTIVVLLNGDILKNNTTITEWEQKLKGFLRIHRSFLVNPDKMVLNGNEVIVNSIHNLPVSRKYKQEVMAFLQAKG